MEWIRKVVEGSRMSEWKRNSAGRLRRRGGGRGKGESQVCKARVERVPQGQRDTGVRVYQVVGL